MIVLTLFTYGHWPRLLDCYHDVLVFKQVLLNPAKFRGISNWTHYWIFGFRLFPLHWLYLLFIPISSYLVILSYWLPCFHCYYLLSLRLNKGCSSKFSRWLPDIGKKKNHDETSRAEQLKRCDNVNSDNSSSHKFIQIVTDRFRIYKCTDS